MDSAVASEHADGLRVVTADDCTLADLSALQGYWTQAQYLKLTNDGNRLIEFTDGRIEFLPMPTQRHQAILRFLFLALFPFVRDRGGDVFFAPLRLRIRDGKFDQSRQSRPGHRRQAHGLRGGGHPRVLDRQSHGRNRDRAGPRGRRIPGTRRVPTGTARRFVAAVRFLGQRAGDVRTGIAASPRLAVTVTRRRNATVGAP